MVAPEQSTWYLMVHQRSPADSVLFRTKMERQFATFVMKAFVVVGFGDFVVIGFFAVLIIIINRGKTVYRRLVILYHRIHFLKERITIPIRMQIKIRYINYAILKQNKFVSLLAAVDRFNQTGRDQNVSITACLLEMSDILTLIFKNRAMRHYIPHIFLRRLNNNFVSKKRLGRYKFHSSISE